MSDVSKFNGHDIKDKVARQNIANLELSKASHTDVEEAVNAVNEVVEEVAGNLENLETLFNNAGLNNSADGISYDNTTSGLEAENVQGAIDEIYTCMTKNMGGDFIDVSTYRSDNRFVCTSDGYAYIVFGDNTGYGYLFISGKDDTPLGSIGKAVATSTKESFATFVRKGMKLSMGDNNGGTFSARFMPIQ